MLALLNQVRRKVQKKEFLYYLRQHPAATGHAPRFYADLGFTGVVTTALQFNLFQEALDPGQTRLFMEKLGAGLQGVRRYVSLGTTNHLGDAYDTRFTFIPKATSSNPSVLRYLSNLSILADAGRGIVDGYLFDAEYYGWSYPKQDPAFAWTPQACPRWLATDIVDTFLARDARLTLGQHVLYGLERPLKAYGPFWREFFTRAGRKGVTLYGDSFGRPLYDHESMPPTLAREIASPRAMGGWMLRAEDRPVLKAVAQRLEAMLDTGDGAWVFALGHGDDDFFKSYPEMIEPCRRAFQRLV